MSCLTRLSLAQTDRILDVLRSNTLSQIPLGSDVRNQTEGRLSRAGTSFCGRERAWLRTPSSLLLPRCPFLDPRYVWLGLLLQSLHLQTDHSHVSMFAACPTEPLVQLVVLPGSAQPPAVLRLLSCLASHRGPTDQYKVSFVGHSYCSTLEGSVAAVDCLC